MTRILGFLCLFLAALDLPAIQLIERNGDTVVTREIVSLAIPDNGVVIIVPDLIFAAGNEGGSATRGPGIAPARAPKPKSAKPAVKPLASHDTALYWAAYGSRK